VLVRFVLFLPSQLARLLSFSALISKLTVLHPFDGRFHCKFFTTTALSTVRIDEPLHGTCPQMRRSKTGYKTVNVDKKEQKPNAFRQS
jgi:hypothetical protein